MTDLPSSFGIEAVELVADGGRSVTVRVSGRWRRRRPEVRGQAMLVVEAETGRQRFPAMPEPPSLTGVAPGTWRMSFSVPAALAQSLPGRTFLQLGGVMVPLPVGEMGTAGTELLEERRARGSELAAESARRRAAELGQEVDRLERELDGARVQSERLRAQIAERDRRLCAAEQHIHAERSLRADLEQELARRRRAAQHDLRALHERLAELERDLTRMRRAVDEAQHLAAAAEAGRAAAERRLAMAERRLAVAEGPPPAPRIAPSRRELELLRATPAAAPPSVPASLPERAGDRASLSLEVAMAQRRVTLADARVARLERDLAAAREEIEAQRQRSARAYEAIALVRAELRQLRAAPSPVSPPAAPLPISPAAAPAPAPAPADEPVQAERLSAALARLRERASAAPAEAPEPAPEPTPSAEPAPARPAKAWLEKPFRTLARRDPSAAGRLLLALLPAQRAADPRAVAYDLVLGDLVCAQVTVGRGSIHVEMAQAARAPAAVDFQLFGDLAEVARLLAAGRLRRRLPSRRRARIRGDRRRVVALDHLVRAQLGLPDLVAAGVKLDPGLALTLAATAINPGWTAGERFTIAHRDSAAAAPDVYFHVRDGREPLISTELPQGPVATVVVCPSDEVLMVLTGRAARVEGEERPLVLLRQWLDRAQCG